MKKWHMEGIINGGCMYGRKIIVPDEDQMYRRVHGYLLQARKESVIVSFLREVAGRMLKCI